MGHWGCSDGNVYFSIFPFFFFPHLEMWPYKCLSNIMFYYCITVHYACLSKTEKDPSTTNLWAPGRHGSLSTLCNPIVGMAVEINIDL